MPGTKCRRRGYAGTLGRRFILGLHRAHLSEVATSANGGCPAPGLRWHFGRRFILGLHRAHLSEVATSANGGCPAPGLRWHFGRRFILGLHRAHLSEVATSANGGCPAPGLRWHFGPEVHPRSAPRPSVRSGYLSQRGLSGAGATAPPHWLLIRSATAAQIWVLPGAHRARFTVRFLLSANSTSPAAVARTRFLPFDFYLECSVKMPPGEISTACFASRAHSELAVNSPIALNSA